MAIDYDLEIYDRTRPLDHVAIRNSLVTAFSLQTEDNHFFYDPEANLTVTVIPWLDEDSGNHWERAERSALGFRHAGVNIGFRWRSDFDEEASRLMYRIVNWVLEHYPVDATLSFNDVNNFTLFRSRGQLVLIDDDEWRYDPVLLTLITLPYEYRKARVYYHLAIWGADPKVHSMALANLLLAKFQLSIHPRYIAQRICEGLIATPYRFDDKRPHDFSKPHEQGDNLGVYFEVDVLSYEVGLAKLVAITRWVLEQYDGDATLEWRPQWNAMEPPLLTRTNNTLTLSDEPDFWTPERKAIMLGKPLP